MILDMENQSDRMGTEKKREGKSVVLATKEFENSFVAQTFH